MFKSKHPHYFQSAVVRFRLCAVYTVRAFQAFWPARGAWSGPHPSPHSHSPESENHHWKAGTHAYRETRVDCQE